MGRCGRSRWARWAGWLVLLALACAGGEAPEGDAEAADAPVPLRGKALRRPSFPAVPDAVAADRVLFLPFVNRTAYRLHQSHLRAFEESLATYAAAIQGLRPVRGEVARALARQIGIPSSPWKHGDTRVPDPERIAGVAKRVGAGVVVWGEIRKGRSIALHASTHVPGADATPWDGFEMEAVPGPVDLAFYDAPRRLLASLAEAGRIPRITGGAVPSEAARSELRRALALAASGWPAHLRRAETTLARLAVDHPGWSQPWARLAFLRMLRSGAFHYSRSPDAPFLEEGANPARHVARLFPDLSEADRARLDAVDHLLNLHLQTPAELKALLARAPADARLLLAHRHPQRSRALFRLGEIEPATAFERHYRAVAATSSELERRRWALEQSQALEGEALLRAPWLARVVHRQMQEQGEWGAEYGWALVGLVGRVAGALEVLRDRCAALGDAREPCAEGMREFAALYVPEAEAAALDPADPEGWDVLVERLAAQALQAELGAQASAALPDRPVFRDAAFARTWLLASELVDAANVAFRHHDGKGAPDSRVEPLLADARALLRGELSWVLDAAYHQARVGQRRAQKDEAMPYLEALEPFRDAFPVARYVDLSIRSSFGMTAHYGRGWGSLAEHEMFDDRWVGRWLSYMNYSKGPRMSRRNAHLLESVVPGNHTIARFTAKAWTLAEQPERAIEALREGLEPMPDPRLVRELDDALMGAHHPDAERHALLAAAVRDFPSDTALRDRLADVLMWSGHPREAEALYREIFSDPARYYEAYYGLATVLAYRGDPDAVERHYRSSLERAPDRWARAYTYYQVSGFAQLRGDTAAAIEVLQHAQSLVGGAGYVLDGMGRTHEVAGDLEQAASWYQKAIDYYPRGSRGFHRMALLHMRRGDLEAAREVLHASKPDPDRDHAIYDALGRLDLSEGNLESFAALVRETRGEQATAALSDLYFALGDYEREAAVSGEARHAYPGPEFETRYERALLDLGRLEEARAGLEPRFEAQPNDSWLRLQLVRILCGQGELERARRLAQEWRRLRPFSRDGAEMLFHVHRAAGEPGKARAELRRAAAWAPTSGAEAYDGWWGWQRRWLRLEAELGFEDLPRAELDRRIARAEQIVQRSPHDFEMGPVLAKLQRARGDEEAADKALAQAARWNPLLESAKIARGPR